MAYGARLESVLGASPRGFESPIGTLVDGVVSEGSAMVMALQQRFNEGRF